MKPMTTLSKYYHFIALLGIQILIIVGLGIGFSYLDDYVATTGFFNDHVVVNAFGEKSIKWGSRHAWWFVLSVCLLILSAFRVLVWACNYWGELE